MPSRPSNRGSRASGSEPSGPVDRRSCADVSSFVKAPPDGQPVRVNATQSKVRQRRGQDTLVGRVTQGALSSRKPQDGKVVAHNLTGETGFAHAKEELEGKVKAPGLRNRGPLFAREGGPGFSAQGKGQIAGGEGPQDGASTANWWQIIPNANALCMPPRTPVES